MAVLTESRCFRVGRSYGICSTPCAGPERLKRNWTDLFIRCFGPFSSAVSIDKHSYLHFAKTRVSVLAGTSTCTQDEALMQARIALAPDSYCTVVRNLGRGSSIQRSGPECKSDESRPSDRGWSTLLSRSTVRRHIVLYLRTTIDVRAWLNLVTSHMDIFVKMCNSDPSSLSC
jgi:hypothetical protein